MLENPFVCRTLMQAIKNAALGHLDIQCHIRNTIYLQVR